MNLNWRTPGFMPIPLILCLAVGCSREPTPVEHDVETFVAELRSITESRREDGRLQAYRIHNFIPSVGDLKLRRIYVNEGDSVEAGDTLFAFDTVPIDEELRVLNLRTNAIARSIDEAQVHAEARLAEARTTHEQAVRAAAVCKQMAAKGLATEAELVAATRTSESAARALALAMRSCGDDGDTAEVAGLRVELASCHREIAALQRRLEDATGVAPFQGRVLRVNDTIKEYGPLDGELDIRFRAGRGPLMILADTRSMRVVASFFETDIARIRPGQRVHASADHAPGVDFEGEVTAVGHLGYAHGQSATLQVEAVVDNSAGHLRPGLTADLSVVTEHKEAVVSVPARFLRRKDAGYYVLLRKGTQSVQSDITIGIADETFVEILSGLNAGDEVSME